MRRLALEKNKAACAIFVGLAAVSATFVMPSVASAGSAILTCTGQEAISYSPDLTDTPQAITTTVNGMLGLAGDPGLCVALGTDITSATYAQTYYNPSSSCNEFVYGVPNSKKIDWNSGAPSYFSYTTDIAFVNGDYVVTLTGDIASGQFAGDLAVETIVVPEYSQTECAAGIPSSTGQAALVIS
jgi:hypothetical protein